MATGTASGGQCYATQAEAAAMWCSSLKGATSAGTVACVSTGGYSSSSGGVILGTMYLRHYPTGSSTTYTSQNMEVRLQACETYGLDYWAPYQAAFIAALIAITAGKVIAKRIFSHSAV